MCYPDKLIDEKIDEMVAKIKKDNYFTKELSQLSIGGSELSVEKQDWVFEKGKVCLQGWDLKIKEVISDKSELLRMLSGKRLNSLLKQEKPVI